SRGTGVCSVRPLARSEGAALFSREGEDLAGPVDSRDAIPATSERKVVVAGAASEVEDGLRVDVELLEDVLEEIDIAFVVDEPMIDQIVVARESTIRPPGRSRHGQHESLSVDDAMAFARRGPRGPLDTGRGSGGRGPSCPL